MKNKYLILVIIVIGLIMLGLGLYFLLNKNKNNNIDIPIEKNDKIIFKTDKNITYDIGYIDNNNFLAIVLTNNDKKNIVSGVLIIDYGTDQKEEVINLFPVNGKYLIKTQVPTELVKNITNQIITIELAVNEFSNDFSYIDLKNLNKPTVQSVVSDNITTINISGVNNLSQDISCLNGFVLLLNDNKIVGAENFRINSINENTFNTQVKFNKITKPSTNLNQTEPEFMPIEYNKLQVIYTFAY